MKRRDFIVLSASLAAVACATPAFAQTAPLDYSPELLAERLAAGDTVFLDFKAVWCSTCAAQERVITALKAANPGYEAAITFIDVDWDTWGSSDIVTVMNIPRRSTLVVLRGDQELGRIVAGTAVADIQALMDLALAAATT